MTGPVGIAQFSQAAQAAPLHAAIDQVPGATGADDPFGRPLVTTGLYLAGATSAAAGFAFTILGLLNGSNRHLVGGGGLLAGGVAGALLGYAIERSER